MKKASETDLLASRPNLDFSKGVRGKYVERMGQGTNIVAIAPDLLDTFPDSESVNRALRSLKEIARRSAAPPQILPFQKKHPSSLSMSTRRKHPESRRMLN